MSYTVNGAYLDYVAKVIPAGEAVTIIGPAGFKYDGRLTMIDTRNDYVLIRTEDRYGNADRDIFLNPAHIVSISVTAVKL